ncbi:MAG: hypothetical protein V4671_05000 [Armatimonadota bacterium]
MVVVFLVLLFATFLFSANSSAGQRSAIAGVVTLLLFPLVWFVPRAGIPAMLGFLMVMGGLRRSLIPLLGYTELDPIILVSPVVATICFVNLAINRKLRPTTQLGKWTMVLMGCMGIAILNPLQGNPLVGLTGAAFYLVPLMWYCVGRNVGSPEIITKVINTVLFLSVLGAINGLKQHFFGFSDAEREWFRLSSFTNLVGGTERPMSFYTSPAEYANFLAIGILICVCNCFQKQKAYVFVALFLAYALFLTGIRGIIVATAGASTLIWAVQGREMRGWIPRVVIALMIVGVGGFLGLQQLGSVAESVGGGNSGAELVNHQIQGLTDPLSKNSSAHGHLGNISLALISGLKMPIGYGLGASTMGSTRFGGSASFNAETDLATIFYSLGAIGGVVFIGVIVNCFRSAGLYWYHTRAYSPLVIMGILVAANGNWLTPGHYAESALIWALIGCLDRSWSDGKWIPGLTQKRKQGRSGIAVWKQSIARRLGNTTPSWETSSSWDRPTVTDTQRIPEPVINIPGVHPPPGVTHLTPSAKRALARTARESAETPGKPQGWGEA